MRTHEFRCELWLPRPLGEVFSFFADAGNLELLTPPQLNFNILTPRPLEMRVGLLIDYRLGVRGIPLRWQSEITAWEPPHRMDVEHRGPFHGSGQFLIDRVDNGSIFTWIEDFAPPLGPAVGCPSASFSSCK